MKKKLKSNNKNNQLLFYFIYILFFVLFFIASFLPESLWGINFLSFYPLEIRIFFLVFGFIIAMSASGTLGNFFAGLMLLLTSPFEPGDTIKIGNGTVGRIQAKQLFSTILLSDEGEEINEQNTDSSGGHPGTTARCPGPKMPIGQSDPGAQPPRSQRHALT